MINLNTNITFANINRWQVLAFDVNNGRITLRFWAPNNTHPDPIPDPYIDVLCVLSDVAAKSSGPILNPNPEHWNDKIIITSPNAVTGAGGVGAANSLANAQDAYRGAANHSAGLRAVEGRGLIDGWVNSAFNGT